MASTNVFKTNLKTRDSGYTINWDDVYEHPLEVKVTIPVIDWSTFTQVDEPRMLRFDGGYHDCEHDGYGCRPGFHYKREAWDQVF